MLNDAQSRIWNTGHNDDDKFALMKYFNMVKEKFGNAFGHDCLTEVFGREESVKLMRILGDIAPSAKSKETLENIIKMADNYEGLTIADSVLVYGTCNDPDFLDYSINFLNKHYDQKGIIEIAYVLGESMINPATVIDQMQVYHRIFEKKNVFERYTKTEILEAAKGIKNVNMIYGAEAIAEASMIFDTDEMRQLYELHKDRSGHVSSNILNLFGVTRNHDLCKKATKILHKYVGRDPINVGRVMVKAAEEGVDVLDTFDIYYKEFDAIVNFAEDNYERLHKYNFKELNEMRDLIFISPLPKSAVYDILSDPHRYWKRVINDSFASEIKENELDLLENTMNFVLEIHKAREREHMLSLDDGFEAELNRVISQGVDYKSKVRNVRQYCAEVRQRVMDEAADLMVMHNA